MSLAERREVTGNDNLLHTCKKVGYLKRSAMNYVLLSLNLAVISASAYSVLTKKWYRTLPVLSTYVFVLTLISLFDLATYAGQQLSDPLQYTFCRIYLASYPVDAILISLFSVIILFGFLFHMAGGEKTIRRTAIVGCLLTIGFALLATFTLAHTPEYFAEVFWRATSLLLMLAGIFIFIMKTVFSLALEKRFAIVLVLMAICPFAQTMTGYWRGNAGNFLSQAIWLLFTLMLYAALRKGPASQQQSSLASVNSF